MIRFVVGMVLVGCALCSKGEDQGGIRLDYLDRSISPKADLFRYANGAWLDTTPIPPDRAFYGIDTLTQIKTELQLKTLLEGLLRAPSEAGSTSQKLTTLYQDFLDTGKLNRLGLSPLQDLFDKIEAVHSSSQWPALLGELSREGVGLPFDVGVMPDERDSSVMIVHIEQGELPLPDRSYYLDRHDPRIERVQSQYRRYLKDALIDLKVAQSERLVPRLLQLETAWAKAQRPRERLREPQLNYHAMPFQSLKKLTPGFDWSLWWQAVGFPTDGRVIVGQPEVIQASVRRLRQTPLPTMKAWLKLAVLRSYAAQLDEGRAARQFAFESGVLRGIPTMKERWQRALMVLETSMGEGLGRAYVEAYFPATAKVQVETLVHNIIQAYEDSIDALDWLSPETKAALLTKLKKIHLKLGYPDRWRDYAGLTIQPGELVFNIRRANRFEFDRLRHQLDTPVDRDEWMMTPQTVNAYYNPSLNEIVFPAAQLQAPYFDAGADDASNYGNIGFIIGHELSHAFDDQGAEFDGEGNLKDWWTPQDHARFKEISAELIKQYSQAEPIPGVHVNGELTLGENIADNVGLTMAWRAYQKALGGKTPPLIDGFTGPERFFISYAQSWMGKMRDENLMRLLKTDPHAPMDVRTNAAVRNSDAFHETFHTAPGDPLWLAPEERFKLW